MHTSDNTIAGTRESQKLATQEKVLTAALKVFAERGFEAASIRDIAQRAGVNHGLIKYHFESKEELWKRAVDHLFSRLDSEMSLVLGGSSRDPEAILKNWIHAFVHYCANHPEHAQIMNHESIRGSERLKWVAHKHIRPRHELLRPYVEQLAKRRKIKAPAFSLIYMLNAAMQAPFTLAAELQLVHGQDVHQKKFIQGYADQLSAMILG